MNIRWAVMGSGGIARRRTIPEGITQARDCTLVAVHDIDPRVNREVARQFGAAACDSEEALLSRTDVEAVYIATPACAHYQQVLRAARACRHVLCEKPLGMTVEEAQSLVRECRKAGVKLAVDFMMRFHAYHAAARRMIDQGQLGRMVLGRAQLSCWYPPMAGAWRQDPATGGGGSLIDMGGHCLDLLETFLGRTRRATCYARSLVHPYRSEDTAVVMAEFETGAVGFVDTCFNIPDRASPNRLELYGSKGSILAEGTIGQGQAGSMLARVEQQNGYQSAQTRRMTDGLAIEAPTVNLYKAQIEDVNSAIREDRQPLCDGEAGLWSQKVLAACYESSRISRTVEVA